MDRVGKLSSIAAPAARAGSLGPLAFAGRRRAR
jgi:hypothetical protein